MCDNHKRITNKVSIFIIVQANLKLPMRLWISNPPASTPGYKDYRYMLPVIVQILFIFSPSSALL